MEVLLYDPEMALSSDRNIHCFGFNARERMRMAVIKKHYPPAYFEIRFVTKPITSSALDKFDLIPKNEYMYKEVEDVKKNKIEKRNNSMSKKSQILDMMVGETMAVMKHDDPSLFDTAKHTEAIRKSVRVSLADRYDEYLISFSETHPEVMEILGEKIPIDKLNNLITEYNQVIKYAPIPAFKGLEEIPTVDDQGCIDIEVENNDNVKNNIQTRKDKFHKMVKDNDGSNNDKSTAAEEEAYEEVNLSDVKNNFMHKHIDKDNVDDVLCNVEDLEEEQGNQYMSSFKSWLQFNDKIIYESTRSCNPLMEKINFLAIAESNLDEFIMTKYYKCKSSAHNDVIEQTKNIELQYTNILTELRELYDTDIIEFGNSLITDDSYTKIEKRFVKDILPLLQISVLNDTTTNPHLLSGAIYLIVEYGDNNTKTSIIKIPTSMGRLIKVPGLSNRYILLEHVIKEFLFVLFANTIKSAELIRTVRKADSIEYNSRDTSTGSRLDYITSISTGLSSRIYEQLIFVDKLNTKPSMDSDKFDKILLDIELSNKFIANTGCISTRSRKFVGGITFINELKGLIKTKKSMFFESAIPRIPFEFERKSMFETITEGDVLIHYPYEDFELATQRFINEAAVDKDVITIKQSLYRVSNDSTIVQALKQAAINGKEVTVLLELKAKFDEKNNIESVDILRSAGVNILFGPLNMKTHAKMCIIGRKENGRVVRYCNISTGNFNNSTAKVYEDYSLFTKDTKKSNIGYDALMLFNHLSMGLNYDKPLDILIAPYNMKAKFIELIDKCINSKGFNNAQNGSITLKLNGLTDKVMIDKLYEASSADVKVDIICRGMCSLIPGVTGLSENITVKTVIGRYLEHSRVYKFNYTNELDAQETEDVFIGSADFMGRNLNNRIEVVVPIYDKHIKKEIKAELKLYMKDNVNSYQTLQDGTFTLPTADRGSKGDDVNDIQKTLIKKYRSSEESKLVLAEVVKQ